MPGFNQQQLAYKVLNANQVSVLVGDQLVGFAQTSSPSQDFGTDAYYGVGSSKPQEIQQQRFSQTIALDQFKLTAEGLAFFGESTPLSVILAGNQFNIFLVDNTGVAFLSYVGCTASGVSTNISANQAVSESITFMALDVLDQNGNSLLNNQDALAVNFASSAAGGTGSTPTAP